MPGKTITTRGGTAVMQNRAPKDVEGDNPLAALHRSLDFFPTPPWATRAGAEALQALDPTCKVVKDPACGEGHMAGVLEEYFETLRSDVHPYSSNTPLRDWLDDEAWSEESDCDWIVTNPPFVLADQFVTKGLVRARRGVALLLRIAFMEGVERHKILDGELATLTQLATFSERVPMTLGRWQTDASSATCYAWFFWMKDAAPKPPVWFGPGTRGRLWLPTDADRYGYKPPLSLFSEEDLSAARDMRASLSRTLEAT